MNVLLTSVGRRAYIVKYFQKALNGGEVHVCNSDDKAVAFKYADHAVVSPLIYSKQYIPFLLQYCKEHKIDFLLSLFDTDLPMLAKHKDAFAEIGTYVVVSNQEFIEICNDKWKTYQFLASNYILTPKTFLSIEDVVAAVKNRALCYPIIVKPRFGCGSIGLNIAEDEDDLKFFAKKTEKEVLGSYLKYESELASEKVIFQEYLHGEEHGVDIINDLDGNFINAIVKRKIAMRSGETDIAEVVSNSEIYEVAKRISQVSHHIANVDADFFLVNGTPYVLEMNARFGGGYPFSHMAGCDLPLAIVKWLNKEKVDTALVSARYNTRFFKEITLTCI